MAKNFPVGRAYAYLKKLAREEILWATVIISVRRIREVDISDADRREGLFDVIAEQVEDFRSNWTSMTRGRNLPGTTWRGVIEMDLRREIQPGSHAALTLASLQVDTRPLEPDERVLVLHAHVILEGSRRPHDGDPTGNRWAGTVRSVFRANWPGPWRTLIKGLRRDQTVPEAISNLYGYCHKRRTQYSTGGLGDQPVKFCNHYEMIWKIFVISAYGQINTDLRSTR